MDDGSELREPVSSGAKPASGKPEGALGSLFSHWSEDLAAGTKQQELEEMWRTTKQQQDFVDEEAAPSEKTSKDAPRKSAPAETKTDEKEASKEDRPSS